MLRNKSIFLSVYMKKVFIVFFNDIGSSMKFTTWIAKMLELLQMCRKVGKYTNIGAYTQLAFHRNYEIQLKVKITLQLTMSIEFIPFLSSRNLYPFPWFYSQHISEVEFSNQRENCIFFSVDFIDWFLPDDYADVCDNWEMRTKHVKDHR